MTKPRSLMTPEEIERHRARSREWNWANPEKCRATAIRRKERARTDAKLRAKLNEAADRCRYRRKYGITYEDRDAALIAQGNKCLLCDKPGPNQTDHSHSTGKFRGMLCAWCNIFVGHIEASEDRHRRALAYIALHRLPDNDPPADV